MLASTKKGPGGPGLSVEHPVNYSACPSLRKLSGNPAPEEGTKPAIDVENIQMVLKNAFHGMLLSDGGQRTEVGGRMLRGMSLDGSTCTFIFPISAIRSLTSDLRFPFTLLAETVLWLRDRRPRWPSIHAREKRDL